MNFQLSETSPEKILSILKDLNPSKGAGIDNLSGKFLKDGAHVLAQPISQLLPLFKKDSNADPQNYPIISLLPLLSKIIERIVNDQTEEFLCKNKLLCKFQLGFQKNYSTHTCYGHLTDKITTGFKKNLFT